MKLFEIAVFLCALSSGAGGLLGTPCNHSPNVTYDAGCRSYTRCVDGRMKLTSCLGGLVYNKNTGTCDNIHNVPKPCGVWEDCSVKPDAKYPDTAFNCTYFYTCSEKRFFGHNPCPANLVFNYDLQVCDWRYDVLPPCGTKA